MILRALPRAIPFALAALMSWPAPALGESMSWPPPREPADVASAESLAVLPSPVQHPATAPDTARPAPRQPRVVPRWGATGLVRDDEVRLAVVAYESAGDRFLYRGPQFGVTVLTGSGHEGIGRVGALSAVEFATMFAAGALVTAAVREPLAGVGPLLVMLPVVALSNSQVALVVAGPHGIGARRGPALEVFAETYSDLFFPHGDPPWLRWEPAAGLGVDVPFGAGKGTRRQSVVLQAGLGGRVDWIPGGRFDHHQPRPFVELQLLWGFWH